MCALSGVVGRASVGSIGWGCMVSHSCRSGGGERSKGGVSMFELRLMLSFVVSVLRLRGCWWWLVVLCVVALVVAGLLWWARLVVF